MPVETPVPDTVLPMNICVVSSAYTYTDPLVIKHPAVTMVSSTYVGSNVGVSVGASEGASLGNGVGKIGVAFQPRYVG